MANINLEQLQNQEPIVFRINKIIQDEYEKLKAKSKSYTELRRNCRKRSNEIAYRHPEIGRCVKKNLRVAWKKIWRNSDAPLKKLRTERGDRSV